MSSDLSASAIHAQTSAILEKLYDERGQPDELDEAFIEEYFKLVKNDLNLQVDDESEVTPLVPHAVEVKFSEQHKGLIEVYIPDEKEKFVVSKDNAIKTIVVTAGKVGHYRGEGSYVITDVNGIPNITIQTGSALLILTLGPSTLEPESGTGEWVDA